MEVLQLKRGVLCAGLVATLTASAQQIDLDAVDNVTIQYGQCLAAVGAQSKELRALKRQLAALEEKMKSAEPAK